ncbi:MAG: hypothetical protein RJA58_1227 [Pseudomonadota bacterium]
MTARPAALTAAPSTSLPPVPKSTATKSALVIAPQWVGDAIVSLPLIAQLRREYAAVDVLVMSGVAAVYQACPDVREVIALPFQHGALQWFLRRKTAAQIKGRYETAVVLPNSLKSALIPWLAGIPIRRGMLGEHRYLLLNDRRSPPPQTGHGRPSMLAHYLSLADHPTPFQSIDAAGEHRPRLVAASCPVATAVPEGPLLMLCPGAEYGPAKQWPAEHFAALGRQWIAQSPDHHVVILGGPKDIAVGTAIQEYMATAGQSPERVMNLCGKTSLTEAFGWLSHATVVVSNDSGLMHAAAALDVPVVGLFGSSDPDHTPPLSPKAVALSLRLSCSPCFERNCPLGTTACLRDLSPDHVQRAVRDVQSIAPFTTVNHSP